MSTVSVLLHVYGGALLTQPFLDKRLWHAGHGLFSVYLLLISEWARAITETFYLWYR